MATTTPDVSTAASNIGPSLIRTWVPVVVGSLLAWLANLGIHLSAQYQSLLVVTLVAGVIGVYYTAVRYLETKFSWAGRLLGSVKTPVYTAPVPAPAPVVVSPPPAPPAV